MLALPMRYDQTVVELAGMVIMEKLSKIVIEGIFVFCMFCDVPC